MSTGFPYSVQFAAIQGLAPSSAIGEIVVPSGFVHVARDINVYNETGLASESDLWFKNFTRGNTLYRWTNNGPGTLVGFFTGRQVFTPGDVWGVISTAGSWDVQISGYLLTIPP